MSTPLTPEEVRIIACLMAKAVTTPDQYPGNWWRAFTAIYYYQRPVVYSKLWKEGVLMPILFFAL